MTIAFIVSPAASSSTFVTTAKALANIEHPLNQFVETAATTATTSSLQVADAAVASPSFEPVAPDTTTLLGFGGIVVLCAIAGWVWANQVVPVSRTKLALSKKSGPVREYLDELREAGATSTTSLNNSTTTEALLVNATTDNVATEQQRIKEYDRAFERWLFTDWLEQPSATAGRKKEPALPILKDAKWNSGDNPVVAATGLILLGVLFTAVTERIATMI